MPAEWVGLAIGAMISGAIGLGFTIMTRIMIKKFDKMDKRLEERTAAKMDTNIMIIEGIDVIGKLSKATAVAYRPSATNGHATAIDEAVDAYDTYVTNKDKMQRAQVVKNVYGA